MTEELNPGCARPVSKRAKPEVNLNNPVKLEKEEEYSMIKVGKPAPMFEAPAFHQGKFINVNLEDYKGKWVVLCFYPGDFTFV